MTSEAKAELSSWPFLGGGGCDEAMENVGGLLDAGDRERLGDFEIEAVKIDGDRATVTSSSDDADPTELRKKGGDAVAFWRDGALDAFFRGRWEHPVDRPAGSPRR